MKTEDTHFVWSDDEVQRLSETKKYLKAKKAYAGVDWESIKDKYEIVKPLCQIYPNRQVVKNVHIQQTSSLEKRLQLKSNRFEQNIEKLWMQDRKVEEVE